MELGIDVGDLDLVAQYGPPCSIASFLRRRGRVGRRGQPTVRTFILQNSCDLPITVATIESAMQHKIEPLTALTHADHVMVQQLFLLLKSRHSVVSQETSIISLRSLSPFAEIAPTTIMGMLQYLEE
jgi:ATP-dependent Lhr-like helicase